jgi:putative peptide zinc metalloprotease protein
VSTNTLRFNPAVEVFPFDGAAREPMVMCEVPRADSSVARFVLPARLVDVCRLFDGRPTGEVARACAEGGHCAPEDFDALVEKALVPRGFLLLEGAEVPPPSKRVDRMSYMTLRVPLLRPGFVGPVARGMSWLFRGEVMAVLLAAVVGAHFWFYLHLAPAHGVTFQALRGSHAGAVALLMVLSTVLHEFGHAAAAARFGCRRLEIGWGMYFHMSVLYTDLSEAWRLRRTQRALVDVGGIYVQAVFASALLAAAAWTGSPVALFVFVATDLAIAGSLNPFFRMDGYWLLSDLLGIPNLQGESISLLRDGVYRLFGRTPPPRAPRAFGRKTVALLAVYGAVATAFFVMALRIVGYILYHGVLVRYPQVLGALRDALAADPLAPGAVAGALFAVVWRSLVLFGTARFAYNLFSRLVGGCVLVARLLQEARRAGRPAPALPGA